MRFELKAPWKLSWLIERLSGEQKVQILISVLLKAIGMQLAITSDSKKQVKNKV